MNIIAQRGAPVKAYRHEHRQSTKAQDIEHRFELEREMSRTMQRLGPGTLRDEREEFLAILHLVTEKGTPRSRKLVREGTA